MGAWSASRRFAFGAGAAGVAVAGVVVWLTLRGRLEEAKSSPFRECATEVGLTWQMKFLNNEQGEKFKINLYDHGCGLAVGDFDGDGHDDIYFCNQLGKNALYRNKGDGTFVDVAEEAGVALGDRICVAAAFVDYDNDGKPDLFVTSTRGGNVLFHNKGDGTFVDVTKEVGLEHVGHSQTPVFFDYDNDGYLDLFLTNTAEWTTDTYDKTSRHWLGQAQFEKLLRSRKEHNILYHNEPDGKGGRRFVNVTEKSGLKGLGWAGDAVAFDFDDDGKPDLFVTNMFGRSQLYRNNGDGTFTDVTGDRLGRTPHGAVGTNVFDFDNDGRLDLYVVDMHSDMWMGADFNHSSLMLALEWENRKYPTLAGPVTSQDPAALERDRQEDERSGIRHAEVFFGNGFYRPIHRDLRPGRPGDVLAVGHHPRRLHQRRLSGRLHPLRHGLPLLLLAQLPADEPGRRDVPQPREGDGHRAAAAGHAVPRADLRAGGGPQLARRGDRRLSGGRPAGHRGEQLQRPALLLQEPVPTQELRRLSVDRHELPGAWPGEEEQPRRPRGRGAVVPGGEGDDPAGTGGGRLPVAVLPDGPLRPRGPAGHRPRGDHLAHRGDSGTQGLHRKHHP